MRYLKILKDQLAQLEAERSQLIDQADTIAKGPGNRSESELRRAQQLLDEAEGLHEPIGDLRHKINQLESIEGRTGSTINDTPRARGTNQARGAAIDTIERSRSEFVSDGARSALVDQLENDEDPETDAVAAWVTTVGDPNYRSAFLKLLADPNTTATRMTPEEHQAFGKANELHRSMNIGTPGQGGYMMPFELDPSITLTGNGYVDRITEFATTRFLATNEWHGVNSAGVVSSWDDEIEAVSDDTPTLTQPSIKCHPLRTFVPYSIVADQDIAGLAAELNTLIMDDQGEKQSIAFWTGDGTDRPLGIVTALDASTTTEVVVTTSGAYGIPDVYKLHEALPARFRERGVFAANIAYINRTRRFGEGTSGSQSAFWVDLGDGKPAQLIGQPIIEASPMTSALTTNSDPIVVFADLSKYIIARRPSTVEVIPHLMDVSTGRPTAERGLWAQARVGGGFVTTNAGRLLKSSS